MAREIVMTVTEADLERIHQSIDWDGIRAMTDEEIEQAIADDPDASPLTEAEGMSLRLQFIRHQARRTAPAEEGDQT